MKTATVSSRSRYSSMSKLMKLGVEFRAARRNTGRSESMMWPTASSNAHGLCGATVADTLTDT